MEMGLPSGLYSSGAFDPVVSFALVIKSNGRSIHYHLPTQRVPLNIAHHGLVQQGPVEMTETLTRSR